MAALWIGLGIFAIGFVLRLYYGLKLKKMREFGTEQTDERAKTYKKIVWVGYILFWGRHNNDDFLDIEIGRTV